MLLVGVDNVFLLSLSYCTEGVSVHLAVCFEFACWQPETLSLGTSVFCSNFFSKCHGPVCQITWLSAATNFTSSTASRLLGKLMTF